jgi:cytochrome c oxidase subunit III
MKPKQISIPDFVVAHQFDDAPQQRSAVRLGMWTFLATEILFFGGLFTAYTIYHFAYPEAFREASRTLDWVLGTTNTAILISSSLSMAMAVHAAEKRRRHALAAFLSVTAVLGAIFLSIKCVEYAHKFHEHHVPGPYFEAADFSYGQAQLFFSLYFSMTGLHALHMVIGIGLLLALIFSARQGRFESGNFLPVEMTGLYWHFVDIVWIFLFPLLYLIGRHR